jgi:hypothetical protein
MNRAHRVVGNRKSSPCQSASQVVLGIAMAAGKIWTSQADDSFHLSRRNMHGEQFSSKPKVNDAPVNVGEAFLNMPTRHPASINAYRSLSRERALTADVEARIQARRQRSCGPLCDGLHGRTQQILGSPSQNRARFDDFDPRSRTGGSTTLRLLIGEARQSSQVTPAGASQVSSVDVSQLFTHHHGYERFQGGSADMNPGLEMARASLKHHTRLMPMGAHARQCIGRGVIQIEENITSIGIFGVGEQIDIKALKIACPQKAQYRSPRQLPQIPHSFTWAGPSCVAMDQANQIEIIRHGRQLPTDRVQREKESAIEHEAENATEAPRAYNDFAANGNSPLNAVSHSRGASQSAPSSALHPPKTADIHRLAEIAICG